MEQESNNHEASMELPQPTENGPQAVPEQGSAPRPEMRGMRMPGPVPPAQPPATSPTPPIAHPATLQSQPTGVTDPRGSSHTAALIADDADLIEKEWVTKAKAIVMQTKDDPHEQNREMNKVKADYLKKRYNKDLKVSEG